MKNNIIRFTAGFMTCFFLMSSITVYGESIKKNIDILYDNIKIVIDGVEITPKDSKGEAVEPFMYNGTTYLPVRAVSEAFGKTVTWDGQNKKIYISSNGEIPKEPREVYLYKEQYLATNIAGRLHGEDNNFNANVQKDIFFNRVNAGDTKVGDKYVKDYFVTYALNGKATSLIGRMGPYNNIGDTDIEVVFTILNEKGNILYQSQALKKGDNWINLNLDVKDAMEITFKATVSSSSTDKYISPCFSDIRVLTTDY